MAIGLGILRLPPETFWCMTLPELSAAASAFTKAESAMTRPILDALAARFPDEARSGVRDD